MASNENKINWSNHIKKLLTEFISSFKHYDEQNAR